jgi:Lanthionine synthetase C-like protein
MLVGATAFVDGYLDVLRALQPREVGATPCFGYGRGGIAYTLLKAGILRSDPALVASARRWAAAGIRSARTFRLRGWPRLSFSRGLTGLHAIHALAAHAAGDPAACRRELQRFTAAARRARGSVELFQGMAGRLAGAAIVLRRIADPDVRALGDDLAAQILRALEEASADRARAASLGPPGVAHGWAGVALGALSWHAVTGAMPEAALRRAVIAAHRELAAPSVRGWSNWARGHAGAALLFARAYLQLGDRRFLTWAREAATAIEDWPRLSLALVRGAPGVAYGMLAVAAADPAGPWRDLAWKIATWNLAHVDIPDEDPYGVWSGLGGLCCLLLDLIHETPAGFPGIEA